jgi:hypothetical protein
VLSVALQLLGGNSRRVTKELEESLLPEIQVGKELLGEVLTIVRARGSISPSPTTSIARIVPLHPTTFASGQAASQPRREEFLLSKALHISSVTS